MFHKFHPIFTMQARRIKCNFKYLDKLVPIIWQIILTNEGSFTLTLDSLTYTKTRIKMSQKKYEISSHITRSIRCVWLENTIYTKLTFARSLWLLTYKDLQCIEKYNYQPIGQSFIESKTDIYKQIHEIYYGHCQYLEKYFKTDKPIWGRKYTLYYKNISYTTIQEFFSPNLINFFYT
uniref:Uncharacterized protein n=1 Tax=Plumaria plumosa TaxID=189642 RepID=A0A4D6WZ53_9FLOR|nr:hypothetical protein [Plumaria plumosa]